MVRRDEITDQAWKTLQPLLPPTPRGLGRPGGRWADHRMVLNGILWRLRTGAPWRDIPERYGPWSTCYDRFCRWRRNGTWDRILAHLHSRSDTVGEVVWEISIDSTINRAHQHAAGAHHQPAKPDQKGGSSTRHTKPSIAHGAG
jgi:transposase